MLEGETMEHGSRVFVLTPGRESQQQQREKEKELDEYYIRSEKGVSYFSTHIHRTILIAIHCSLSLLWGGDRTSQIGFILFFFFFFFSSLVF
jgi:hypothetical protein